MGKTHNKSSDIFNENTSASYIKTYGSSSDTKIKHKKPKKIILYSESNSHESCLTSSHYCTTGPTGPTGPRGYIGPVGPTGCRGSIATHCFNYALLNDLIISARSSSNPINFGSVIVYSNYYNDGIFKAPSMGIYTFNVIIQFYFNPKHPPFDKYKLLLFKNNKYVNCTFKSIVADPCLAEYSSSPTQYDYYTTTYTLHLNKHDKVHVTFENHSYFPVTLMEANSHFEGYRVQ
jgi:hypothetical protein